VRTSGIERPIFLMGGLIMVAIASTLIVACRHGLESSAGDLPRPQAAPGPSPGTIVPTGLIDTSWRLIRIENKELDAELPVVTLTFESTRLIGSGGCNWYTGWLENTDGGLTISHLAATRTDCVHPRIMDREARYLADLERFTVLRWAGDALALMADENLDGWLLFTRDPPLLRGA
jgi:heat shock protein HslJ